MFGLRSDICTEKERVVEVIEDEYAHFLREKKKMDERQERLAKIEHLREEKREAFKQAEEEEVADDIEDYKRRRVLQLKEINVNLN